MLKWSLIMKNILITGATRGIGFAVLEKFAKADYNVICLYKNSDEIATQLEQKYLNVTCYKCDISNFEIVNDIASEIIAVFGQIDIIVNNASISKYGLFSETTEQDFCEIFDTNVNGTYNVTHAFCKNMVANHSGNIINISSMWGQIGASMEVLYSSTKGAIIAFTKALAKELGLSNIRVNCIAPGIIKTDMIGQFDAETLDNLAEETPLNRLGTPQDVADLVWFLASDESSFITGQVFGVNGGFVV